MNSHQKSILTLLLEYYCLTVNETVSKPVVEYITHCMLVGMEPRVILSAMVETAWSSNPSPRYFQGVLRNYEMCGVMKYADLGPKQRYRLKYSFGLEAETPITPAAVADLT